MLKFGILGIGQGGSNVAEYAFTKGFKAVIANTAEVDLQQAEYIPNDCKIHLGGMGAGRSREVGMQAMINNAEKVFEKCKTEFADCDAVFVAATGGGGTGSGGFPIGIEILMNFHKYVGGIIVLPDEAESPKAKMNTLECFSQISEFENLGSIFILDNQKVKEMYPTLNRKQVYSITNRQVIDLICELNALTEQPSYVSNFDACDFLGIIQERGYTMIGRSEFFVESGATKFDIAKKIRESWSKSCQPAFTDGQIMKGAILGKMEEKNSAKIDTDLIFQETGLPYDFNDAYFPAEISTLEKLSSKSRCIIYTILSGLAFPEQRLGVMNGTLKMIEERLTTNFQKSQTQTFQTESWSNKFSPMNKRVVGLERPIVSDKPLKIDLTARLSKFQK
jgi:cell division GTPase FtsZ